LDCTPVCTEEEKRSRLQEDLTIADERYRGRNGMAAEAARAACLPTLPETSWHRASALMLATLPEQQEGLFDLVSFRLAFVTWRQQICVIQPQQDAAASSIVLGLNKTIKKSNLLCTDHCIT